MECLKKKQLKIHEQFIIEKYILKKLRDWLIFKKCLYLKNKQKNIF